MLTADVLIAGAGPAGSIAAYYLAQQGINITIIDKSVFPRYKSCGGGLTAKVFEILPFDVSEVIEKEIFKMSFSHRFEKVFYKESEQYLIKTVMRDTFDEFLLKKAIEVGAVFMPDTELYTFEQANGYIVSETKQGQIKSKILLGANGARSLIPRSLNINNSGTIKGFGIEYEIEVAEKDFLRFENTIHLDWGTIPSGYAWVFPKKNHLSVGVGTSDNFGFLLKDYYKEFVHKLDLDIKRTLSVKGHPIPSRSLESKIFSGSVILAGDAAGLSDPFTGEGIYYAIRSGELAAKAIIEKLNNKINSFVSYQKAIDDEIMTELTATIPLMHHFNAIPSVIHNYINNGENGWRNFCRVVRGELSYTAFEKKFGRLQFMWIPAWKIAKIVRYLKGQLFVIRFRRKKKIS